MPRPSVCVVTFAVGAAVAVSGPGRAEAQHARYKRPQPQAHGAPLSARVQPPAPVAPSAPSALSAPSAPAAPAAKPTVDVTTALGLDPLNPPRPEQEQILAQLIENTPDSEREEKADYLFRLAMLYATETRRWMAGAAGGPGAPGAAKVADQAKQNLLKAVKTFKALTDNDAFRAYPKLDVALFHYGYTLQVGRYLKEARAVYDKLLKTHPTSRYVPHAHLSFAEYYVDAGQLADAEARYKQVLHYPKTKAYWFAQYKLGWIYVAMQRSPEALAAFAAVATGTRGDASYQDLYAAATRDLAERVPRTGPLEAMFDTLGKTMDPTIAAELVMLAADDTRERGDLDRANAAYRQLITRRPDDPRGCLWRYHLARATIGRSDVSDEDRVRAIEQLVASYKRLSAAGSADTECRDNAAAVASEIGTAYLMSALATSTPGPLVFAERLLSAHVDAFADASATGAVDTSATRSALAEVRWSRADAEPDAKQRAARWERAALAFAAIKVPDAAHAANLAWLNAIDFVVPTKVSVTTARPRTAPRPRTMSTRDAAIVASLTAYLADPMPSKLTELAPMRLALATTLRRYRHYGEAIEVLDVALAKHGNDASAEFAALLLLDSLVQARSANLTEVIDAMIEDTTFVAGKSELLRVLVRLRK